MNTLAKNILLWVVIVLGMWAVYSRHNLRSAVDKGTCVIAAGGQMTCPPPSGSLALDAAGHAVCGRGECLQGSDGGWLCSAETGGHVGRKGNTGVACAGGCEAASASVCENAR
jgi:hypothetical protein